MAAPSRAGLPPRPVRAPADPARPAPFAPSTLPSEAGSPVDCVIIAPDSLADLFQPLADYQTRSGIRTAVRALSTVRAADPRSNDLPQAVRTFLRLARDLWGTRWAILGGDHDVLPMRMVRVTFFGGEEIPTDAYYADLDGTWDGNGNGVYGEVADSLDMEPDIAVGRLSAQTRAEASLLVAKTLRYETNPIPGPMGKQLTLAEVLFPSTWQPGQLVQIDGAAQGESLRVRAPSCAVVDRYYENSTPYPGAATLTKAAALAALGRGYGVVNHIGHGSRSQLSVGSQVLTLSDIATVANGDSLVLWISSNCASAAVDFDCIAERIVRNPLGGAFAYIGATRDAFPGVSARLAERLFDSFYAGPPTTLGEAVEDARATLLPKARNETQERWGYFETVLLGAPTVPIWACPPTALTVTKPSGVPLSAGGFSVSVSRGGAPVESALVVAWKADEEYRTGFTDAAGQVVLPFHPASVGSFSLAVTKAGSVPYLDSLSVTADAPAHFAVVGPAVSDAGFGDGDGSADAGERFALSGTIKNTGGAASSGPVSLRFESLSSGLVVERGTATLAVLGAGAQTSIPDTLRLLAIAAPNAARAERLRLIVEDAVRSDSVEVPIVVAAADPLLAGNIFSDAVGGNGNGILEAGETATLSWSVANAGTGRARAVSIHATNPAVNVALFDSTGSAGDVLPGAAAPTPAVRFQVSSDPTGRLFDLRIEDEYGHAWMFPIERSLPGAPTGLAVEESGPDRLRVGWSAVLGTDVAGYRVYRALDDGSPVALVTPVPLRRIASYEDQGLTALTRYRYEIAAVDSSGNEGPHSAPLVGSTTPPSLAGWPATLGESTSSSIGLADLDGDGHPEILLGAEYLYVFRPDGTDWLDGDSNPVTTGIFSTALHHIPSSPAAADVDLDGVPELIAASWNDSSLAVWKTNGTMMPGWPRKGAAPFWSTPAVGDIDHDGIPEIVVGSNTSKLYAWHANGVEVRDGDSNPSTNGVFFVPSGSVISSPAIADLDGDGVKEIVFGSAGGTVYALHADGSPLTGWPRTFNGLMSSSPAIGDVIPGGGLEVVMCSSADSVYVLLADGTRAPGWPQPLELTPGNGRVPSAALGRLRGHLGDPSLDVVACGVDGTLRAWAPTGALLPGWSSVHLGTGGASATTEASPTIADLDGDGALEVLMGADDRRVYAFHSDGTLVSGFPIETGAEVLASPAIWDVDGDGRADLILAGWDRQVHVWGYPGSFSEVGMAWPLFRHDNWRTGLATFPLLTSTDPDSTPPPQAVPPPARPMLGQNRPNPFNPVTVIPFAVPGAEPLEVRLRVYDVSGRLVATLLSRRLDPGYHEVRWNGRGDRGEALASGVYFYRAEIGRERLTRKMALLK
jgi:peptidase C25-like protein/VCBS repeat protein/flagellar hook capping protein FlgD/fibronectin type III domain protein